jgi:hypothetical protein
MCKEFADYSFVEAKLRGRLVKHPFRSWLPGFATSSIYPKRPDTG